ncbi:major facilitator superfamily domain-containing protein [Acrodontium crateriforme]|uniref:Major facilitator superfamily domain-containing protein n=1 Tax=Acrodontium crateriforme TaxID=150365 RepID=A0AAQ3M2N9_9PEZI|nr:major facilitator superfamily domain-containing protein [Acrodontium crateriforme]
MARVSDVSDQRGNCEVNKKRSDHANRMDVDEEQTHQKEQAEDEYLVTWKGPDDKDNPKNWNQTRKWLATFLISGICLSTLMSSTMIAASLDDIARDLNIGGSADTVVQLALSAFVLSFAFAPMFFGPLSDIYGRVGVLQGANLFFLVWTVVSGFSQNKSVLIVGRLFSGIGGGAIYAIGSGFLGDVWAASERGKSFAIYNAVPLLGPTLGPLLGGIITFRIGWRWIFWIMAIFDAAVLLPTLVLPRETHARTILYRRMRKQGADSPGAVDKLHTVWDKLTGDDNKRNARKAITQSSTSAFVVLASQQVLQIIAVYQAILYGIMFIALSTFASIWTNVYHETTTQSGLHYISVAIGSGTASIGGALLNDKIWRHLSRNGNVVPEHRVLLMIPGAIIVPVGLFWYGWSVQMQLHWIIPDIGMALFFFGISLSGNSMTAYVIDTYPDHTASAMAAVTFLRSIMGFAFPLFAPRLYTALGYGWGNSLLAFVVIVIGWPIPLFLKFYGLALRKRSGL